MGCDCGGSGKSRKEPPTLDLRRKQLAARDPRNRLASPPHRRSGGPGEVGYTWDGPPGAPGTA